MKLTISVVIIITSVILGGSYFATQVIKQKSIEKQQQVAIEQEKQDRKDLDACFAKAEADYLYNWNNKCKFEKKADNCGLSTYLADDANSYRQETKDNCIKKYGK
jgi:hypothetical protein